MNLPEPSLTKNDKKANIFIISVSAIVFLTVVILHELNLKIQVNFDPHIFAKLNALINASVSILLILGLVFVKSKKYMLSQKSNEFSYNFICIFYIIIHSSPSFGRKYSFWRSRKH